MTKKINLTEANLIIEGILKIAVCKDLMRKMFLLLTFPKFSFLRNQKTLFRLMELLRVLELIDLERHLNLGGRLLKDLFRNMKNKIVLIHR